MTEHPGDNVDNRFRAFWMGVLAFLAFGIVLFLALKLFGAGDNENAVAEPPLTKADQRIIDTRLKNREEVEAAQDSLVPEAKLESAKAAAIAALSAKKPVMTDIRLVPVTPPADESGDAAQGEAAAEKNGGEKPDSDSDSGSEDAADGGAEAADEKPEN